MKKIMIFLLAALLVSGCKKVDTAKLEQETCTKLLKDFAQEHNNDTDISAKYDEENDCVELKWDGKFINAYYNLHFKDVLSDNPQTYADGFKIITMLFVKGVTEIRKLEFAHGGTKFYAIPTMSKKIDDMGVSMVGFDFRDEQTREIIELLPSLGYSVTAKYHTNKGPIPLPLGDVLGLIGFVDSYVMYGGKFEK